MLLFLTNNLIRLLTKAHQNEETFNAKKNIANLFMDYRFF